MYIYICIFIYIYIYIHTYMITKSETHHWNRTFVATVCAKQFKRSEVAQQFPPGCRNALDDCNRVCVGESHPRLGAVPRCSP